MFRFLLRNSLFLALFCWVSLPAFAEANTNPEKHDQEEKFKPGSMIMEHIADGHEWHFFTLQNTDGSHKHISIQLPVILYNTQHGFSIFSFGRIVHGDTYLYYKLNEEHKIVTTDGSTFYDFSITKNVIQILISVTLMILIFFSVAKKYSSINGHTAPKGLQNLMEVLVIFVRDEIARPMLGKKANKFLPYLLTIFFFIWINNMLGLFPGSANVTGNIAVTCTLALLTFIITLFSSKRHYWKHILAPPGVPIPVMIILVPVEILGMFTKPFALLIRLFANMTAGHLIVLSFLSLIFIFAEMNVWAGVGISAFSVAFSIFIYCLELLVAALQAYIFTILSALFISEAAVEPKHH